MEALEAEEEFDGAIGSDARGNASEDDIQRMYPNSEGFISSLPKLKIELVVSDGAAERMATAIRKAAHTGKTGDGLIVIEPIEEAVDIRTGKQYFAQTIITDKRAALG